MIIGICNGSRASAMMRIGHGLSHHNRHHVDVAGQYRQEQRGRRQRRQPPGLQRQQQGADDELSDAGRVGVEPRTAGQFDGDDAVERLRRDEVQGADAKQQRRDSVGGRSGWHPVEDCV